LEMMSAINSGVVELLDDPALLRELRGLERRRGSSGRDRVDHRSGSHDDRATCANFGRYPPTWRVAGPDPPPDKSNFTPATEQRWFSGVYRGIILR
jgi:hypothetical protein